MPGLGKNGKKQALSEGHDLFCNRDKMDHMNWLEGTLFPPFDFKGSQQPLAMYLQKRQVGWILPHVYLVGKTYGRIKVPILSGRADTVV